MNSEIVWTDATGLARRIRSKELSPVEVVHAFLDRADAVNTGVNAVVVDIPEALERARAAERIVSSGDPLGPLHGVPVTIILEMQVLRQRRLIWDNLWWDEKIAQLEGRLRIETRPLSKTYLLRNLNSGELQIFASFGKLLVGLGKIRNFPLLDEHLLGDEGHYYLRLRALLDIESLPSPLRPWAYLSALWRLESDWYQWPIER